VQQVPLLLELFLLQVGIPDFDLLLGLGLLKVFDGLVEGQHILLQFFDGLVEDHDVVPLVAQFEF